MRFSRPTNLSKNVFIAPEKEHIAARQDGEVYQPYLKYLRSVRTKDLPVINIWILMSRSKYRYLLEFDLYEGFTGNKGCTLSFTKEGVSILNKIITSKPHKKIAPITSCSYAACQYTSLEDAVEVANQLAAFDDSSEVWDIDLSIKSRITKSE